MANGIFEEALHIPGYLCEALIGRGGMGSVYRALQLPQNRPVAVKILGEGFRTDPEFVARFQNEASSLATLEHPHIVPMLESGEVNGVPFLVMRLIDGPNLRELLRHTELEPEFVVGVLAGIAEALDFAHARGVLHRDVKPHNMLLDHGDHAWLVDFGLMRLAADGRGLRSVSQLAGTFDYLAPELISGASPSVASDVYALAVSAFQLLTGQLPFRSEHVAGLLNAHATSARPAASARRPDLPAAVDRVLAEGMAIDPRSRPASAGALIDGLRRAVTGRGDPARPPTRGPSAGPRRTRTRERPESTAPARPSVVTNARTVSTARIPAQTRRSRRPRGAVMLGLGAGGALIVAFVVVLLVTGAGSHTSELRLVADRTDITRFDPPTAASVTGPRLLSGTAVRVACRAPGTSSDGTSTRWWYRLDSTPWDEQYYARAEDFDASTQAVPRCRSYIEFPGNPGTGAAGTGTWVWTDPQTAGGREGQHLPGFQPTSIICRLRGLKVNDGNTWWYRIGGQPWAGHYYASADAFYNNGLRNGPLKGSAFVDTKVPLCS